MKKNTLKIASWSLLLLCCCWFASPLQANKALLSSSIVIPEHSPAIVMDNYPSFLSLITHEVKVYTNINPNGELEVCFGAHYLIDFKTSPDNITVFVNRMFTVFPQLLSLEIDPNTDRVFATWRTILPAVGPQRDVVLNDFFSYFFFEDSNSDGNNHVLLPSSVHNGAPNCFSAN